jgi:hypothetical protein
LATPQQARLFAFAQAGASLFVAHLFVAQAFLSVLIFLLLCRQVQMLCAEKAGAY